MRNRILKHSMCAAMLAALSTVANAASQDTQAYIIGHDGTYSTCAISADGGALTSCVENKGTLPLPSSQPVFIVTDIAYDSVNQTLYVMRGAAILPDVDTDMVTCKHAFDAVSANCTRQGSYSNLPTAMTIAKKTNDLYCVNNSTADVPQLQAFHLNSKGDPGISIQATSYRSFQTPVRAIAAYDYDKPDSYNNIAKVYLATENNNVVACDVSKNPQIEINTLTNCVFNNPGKTFNQSSSIAIYQGKSQAYAYIANQKNSTVSVCTISNDDGLLSTCTASNVNSQFQQPSKIVLDTHKSEAPIAYIVNSGNDSVSACTISNTDGALKRCQTSQTFSHAIGGFLLTTS